MRRATIAAVTAGPLLAALGCTSIAAQDRKPAQPAPARPAPKLRVLTADPRVAIGTPDGAGTITLTPVPPSPSPYRMPVVVKDLSQFPMPVARHNADAYPIYTVRPDGMVVTAPLLAPGGVRIITPAPVTITPKK